MSADIGPESPGYSSVDSDLIFNVEFISSHVFRQILEFLNPTMDTLPIFFGKSQIHMLCKNGSENFFFQGVFDTHCFTEYFLSPMITKEDPDAVHVINVNIVKLLRSVKELPKRGTFRISQRQSDLDNIILSVVDSPTIPFRLLHLRDEDTNMGFTEAKPIASDAPNKVVPLSKFAHVAMSCGKQANRSSYIRCYTRGVDILGTSSDKGSSIYSPWGECDDSERLCEIKVGAEVMKSMAKLSTLSTEGITRFYCGDPDYMRIEIPIVIGTLFIYICRAGSIKKKD